MNKTVSTETVDIDINSINSNTESESIVANTPSTMSDHDIENKSRNFTTSEEFAH